MEPLPMKKNKSRTAITIDPDLWEAAKAECQRRSEASGKKYSFSSLVEDCLRCCVVDAGCDPKE